MKSIRPALIDVGLQIHSILFPFLNDRTDLHPSFEIYYANVQRSLTWPVISYFVPTCKKLFFVLQFRPGNIFTSLSGTKGFAA